MKIKFLIHITILISFIGISDAANSVRLKSVGTSGGILLPQDNWNNGFSVELQTDFGEIMKYVFLVPHIGFRKTSMQKEGMDLSYTDIYFGTKFIGYFNSKPRGFYAGLGLQYHIIGQEEIARGFDSVEDATIKQTLTRVGYTASAGYLLKLSAWSFSLEPGYTIIPGADNMFSVSFGVNLLIR